MSERSSRSAAAEKKSPAGPSDAAAPPPPPPQQRPQATWLDPGTWGAYKFVPAYVALIALLLGIFISQQVAARAAAAAPPTIDVASFEICATTFDYGFPINAVLAQATTYARRRGPDIAALFDAKTQVFAPDRSVFARAPFPDGRPPSLGLRMDEASLYVHNLIHTKADGGSLFPDVDGSSDAPSDTLADPAALGVAALLTGQRWRTHLDAAVRQKDAVLAAPTHANGALSSQRETVAIRAEGVASFAPFLAYAGVALEDLGLVREAVRQIELHRDILTFTRGAHKGLWCSSDSHPGCAAPDYEASPIENAAVAYSMAQVRATIAAWPASNGTLAAEISRLDVHIAEILDAIVRAGFAADSPGLVRSVLTTRSPKVDESGIVRGDATGTALLATVVYRMAIIDPERFAKKPYLAWAHEARRAVVQRVDKDGFVGSAADASSVTAEGEDIAVLVSPRAQSSLLLLGTAWRDCVCRGVCLGDYLEETGMVS